MCGYTAGNENTTRENAEKKKRHQSLPRRVVYWQKKKNPLTEYECSGGDALLFCFFPFFFGFF
jgi:hypothetical protein